jgi:hypothetical protein
MNATDLIEAITLANGKEDCTCNVAANSNDPNEHDPYCAFQLLKHAAIHLQRGWRARNWIYQQAGAEQEPKAKAAFIESHNAVLAILEGREA